MGSPALSIRISSSSFVQGFMAFVIGFAHPIAGEIKSRVFVRVSEHIPRLFFSHLQLD